MRPKSCLILYFSTDVKIVEKKYCSSNIFENLNNQIRIVRSSVGEKARQKGQLPRVPRFWGPCAFHRVNFNQGPRYTRVFLTRFERITL